MFQVDAPPIGVELVPEATLCRWIPCTFIRLKRRARRYAAIALQQHRRLAGAVFEANLVRPKGLGTLCSSIADTL